MNQIKLGVNKIKDESLRLVISADSYSFCDPQENFNDINKYKTVQLEIVSKEGNIKLEEAGLYMDLKEHLHDDIFNNNVYGYVPIDVVQEIYQMLIRTNKTEDINKKEKTPVSSEGRKSKTKSKKEVSKVIEKNSTNKKTSKVDFEKKVTEKQKSRNLTKKKAQKIVKDIITALNNKIYEKEEEVHSIVTALLAQEHVLLIGKPGEGKTALTQAIGEIIEDGNYFSYLLRGDTFYDDLFGGYGFDEYRENNKIIRNAEGMVQEAHIAFFDEIFKSNSEVLNGMLNLVNEREFDNGGVKQKTPLITAVGASNEFPEEDEGLDAFYDRFILKHWVGRMKDFNSFKKMFDGEHLKVKVPTLTLDELSQIHKLVEKVKIPENIQKDLFELSMNIRDEGIDVSTRRINKCIGIIKANAFIEGRDKVDKEDFTILQHVFWDEYEDKDRVSEIVIKYSFNQTKLNLIEYKKEAENIMRDFNKVDEDNKKDVAIECGQKLRNISLEVQKLIPDASNDEELKNEIQKTLNDLNKKSTDITHSTLVPIS